MMATSSFEEILCLTVHVIHVDNTASLYLHASENVQVRQGFSCVSGISRSVSWQAYGDAIGLPGHCKPG
jgi:hypothetical protein